MKVSVIIPSKGDRGYLGETIASIEAQTHKDYEIIVEKSDLICSENINNAIKKATGKYIKLCADDDLLTPNCLTDSVSAIQGFHFVHGNAINFWANGVVQEHVPTIKKPTLKDMLELNRIHGGTVLYDITCFDEFGGFDESLWCGEEYEFNMRLLDEGCLVGYCNRFLQRYRMHPGQKSLGNTNPEYRAKRQLALEEIRNRYRK